MRKLICCWTILLSSLLLFFSFFKELIKWYKKEDIHKKRSYSFTRVVFHFVEILLLNREKKKRLSCLFCSCIFTEIALFNRYLKIYPSIKVEIILKTLKENFKRTVMPYSIANSMWKISLSNDVSKMFYEFQHSADSSAFCFRLCSFQIKMKREHNDCNLNLLSFQQ